MTREERLELLKLIEKDIAFRLESTLLDDEKICAIHSAIEELEQEPCDDAISRQATVERLCKVAEFMNEKRDGLGSPYVMAALFIQDNKDEFPSVTPKQKMGRWRGIEYDGYADGNPVYDVWECSECGWEHNGENNTLTPFCPNCGTKMEESK